MYVPVINCINVGWEASGEAGALQGKLALFSENVSKNVLLKWRVWI